MTSPDGLYALHRILPNGSENIHYLHTDHTSTTLSTGLGSWTAVTDETGTVVDEQSYDAWGNRRDPATWTSYNYTPPEPQYDRGFTGHEHLDGFQLINPDTLHFIALSGSATANFSLHSVCENQASAGMNGRMYDPVVSRMLAPDNFVQTPDFSQNFNRYSYALNNPLMFTDPDGEWIIPVLYGMLGGGTMHFLSHVAQNGNLDNWNWGDFIGATIAGGLSGFIGPQLARRGIGGAYGGTILGTSAAMINTISSGIINKNLSIKNVVPNTIVGGILGAGIGAMDAKLRGQRWYDGRHPKAHRRYFIPSNIVDGNYYFTEERIEHANDVDYRKDSPTGLPMKRKMSLNVSDPYGLKRNYDGPLSITSTPSIPEGMEFYISIDGVESVYHRYDIINMTVPLSVRSIEWGFRGVQVLTADDYFLINGKVLALPQTFPPTSLSITTYMRPWRGFLFW